MARKPIATPNDYYLARNAQMILRSAREFQAGFFTLTAAVIAAGLTKDGIKDVGARMELATSRLCPASLLTKPNPLLKRVLVGARHAQGKSAPHTMIIRGDAADASDQKQAGAL